MIIKKFLGWLLFIVGLVGITVNFVFVFHTGMSNWTLVINTIICLIFLFGGWQMAHPKEEPGGASECDLTADLLIHLATGDDTKWHTMDSRGSTQIAVECCSIDSRLLSN